MLLATATATATWPWGSVSQSGGSVGLRLAEGGTVAEAVGGGQRVEAGRRGGADRRSAQLADQRSTPDSHAHWRALTASREAGQKRKKTKSKKKKLRACSQWCRPLFPTIHTRAFV